MALFTDEDKQKFPIKNIEEFVVFFKDHLQKSEPNLTLLSIILGCIENALTVNRSALKEEIKPGEKLNSCELPLLELSKVYSLYQKFVSYVKGSVDLTNDDNSYTSRECVKSISELIWSGLNGNYTDKAHLQSLFSYLTGCKLDSFGVALAVTAACQVLGHQDVHLALSEDHVWVVFGLGGSETAEVTWHGKGIEDNRGQPINGKTAERSWLYLDNHAVVCDRFMEVAAMVASINPAISGTTDSVEMARLQQRLLWILYDNGHLEKYPMALGTLGDLEELDATPGRPTAKEIFQKGVTVARNVYANHHIYPHTYLGAFHYRSGMYKEALKNWAEAAEVISQYNYSRDDEEIYKEFLEIAHDLMPHIAKFASDGYLIGSNHHTAVKALPNLESESKEIAFLKDRENYENLLKFYDGICQWEEGSSLPVLHITWAKHFLACVSKFDKSMRGRIQVQKESGDESSSSDDSDDSDSDSEVKPDVVMSQQKVSSNEIGINNRSSSNEVTVESHNGQSDHTDSSCTVNQSHFDNNNGETKTVVNGDVNKTITHHASMDGCDVNEKGETRDTNMADLAKACANGILNPDFLKGKGKPFTGSAVTSPLNKSTSKSNNRNAISVTNHNGSNHSHHRSRTNPDRLSIDSNKGQGHHQHHHHVNGSRANGAGFGKLQLQSAKMRGMKRLVTSERLNTGAICLQMTAQSQVSLKHSKMRSSYDQAVPRKRSRRSDYL